jgi:hypothetical protein
MQLYELFTGNIGSTIRHEYLPKWVRPRPYTGPEQLLPDAPPRAMPISGVLLEAERLDREPTRRVWAVEAGSQGSEVAFPVYYWPGWHASVDGTRVDVEPTPDSGYLSLSIPPGRHVVSIRLGRTPLRLGAEAASLLSALTLLALYVREGSRNRRKRGGEREGGKQGEGGRAPSPPEERHVAIACLPFLVVLTLIVALRPRVVATNSDALTMDFEEMPYLHRNPEGVALDGWRLTGYSYESPGFFSGETIGPGEILRVTLDWRQREDSSTTAWANDPPKLRLIPPAAVRHDEVPAVVEAAIGLDGGEGASDISGRTTVTLTIPQGTAPGIHLVQIPGKPPIYLRPIRIESGAPSTERPARATFADGALRLHDVRATQPAPDHLDVQFSWSASRQVAANYGLSLSLTDAAGNEWLRQGAQPGYNTQPGHGFLPTSLWPLQRAIDDRHLPTLQEGVPPGDAYTLTIDLYRVATWTSVGQYTMTLDLTRTAERPDPPVAARFGEELVLSRLETSRSVWQGERLAATAYWTTLRRPSENYVVDWRLESHSQLITSTQPLAPGSRPKEWPSGAWVTGRVALPIPPTSSPGTYTLSLAVREPRTGIPIDSYAHPIPVEIRERDRVWELPSMEKRVESRFGGMIELAGYDLAHGRESVRLTLHWQALTTPDRHYMFFVHLADPETGEPASQVDTMPRGFNYPTGQWAPGEVVSDVVILSTRDVAPGRYHLAVGWYDPETKQRLRAEDGEGRPLPDDRLILPSEVRLP